MVQSVSQHLEVVMGKISVINHRKLILFIARDALKLCSSHELSPKSVIPQHGSQVVMCSRCDSTDENFWIPSPCHFEKWVMSQRFPWAKPHRKKGGGGFVSPFLNPPASHLLESIYPPLTISSATISLRTSFQITHKVFTRCRSGIKVSKNTCTVGLKRGASAIAKFIVNHCPPSHD